MAGIERRLRKLEARLDAYAETLALTEEARWQAELQATLQLLDTSDLQVLDDVFTALVEHGEDFREVVDRLGAQAVVERFERAWADYRRETR